MNENSKVIDIEYLRKLYPKYDNNSLIPIVKGVVGIGSIALSSVMINNKYFKDYKMIQLKKRGVFLLCYLIGIFVLRVYETKTTSVCMELLWGCNTSLLISSIACFKQSPFLISLSLNLIGLDQLLWHIDIISYLLFKKCKIGVAGYLETKEMGKIRIITSLHHLWFIWFNLNCLKIGKSKLIKGSFKYSMFIGLLSMIIARLITPKYCWFPIPNSKIAQMINDNDTKQSKLIIDKENELYLEYMNINCSFEFYPTVNIPILHYFNKLPSYLYIPMIASCLSSFCYVVHKLLMTYSNKFISKHHH